MEFLLLRVMKMLLLAAIILNFVVANPVSPPCLILSNNPTTHGRDIIVACDDDMNFTFKLEDSEGDSSLQVLGSKVGEEFNFLEIEHRGGSMFLVLNGERYNAKDGNSAAESAALQELLKSPNFSHFPAVVRLIHDELQLPAWESRSVMFLYRIGMSLSSSPLQRRSSAFDEKYSQYHGLLPSKQCQHNGWISYSLTYLVHYNCVGTCGPGCSVCWDWVCGDCCYHTGCLRHDQFCDGTYGKAALNCLNLRGVLWDTITDTPYDC